jgi:anti-sigma factor ChrR (cupin superfamily)
MRHDHATEEIQERASRYVLSVLEPEEMRSFEDHLRECPVCRSEVFAFREATARVATALQACPPALLREKLQALVPPDLRRTAAERDLASGPPPVGAHLVREDSGEWQGAGSPGVRFKQLYVDAVQQMGTMLVRMDPGSRYPGHRHAGAEQCLVLEGDLHFGDFVLRAGDYQCVPTESIHPVSHTEQGCLLLVIASQNDQVLGSE